MVQFECYKKLHYWRGVKLCFLLCGVVSNFEFTHSVLFRLFVIVVLLVDLHSNLDTMSHYGVNEGSFDWHLDDEDHFYNSGHASANCIPPNEGNKVFHMKSVMPYLIQIKGLFGVKYINIQIYL